MGEMHWHHGFGCTSLRKACMAFVVANAAAVQSTDGFKNFLARANVSKCGAIRHAQHGVHIVEEQQEFMDERLVERNRLEEAEEV